MDGTNFRTILLCLRDEGMREEADVVEGIMRNRAPQGFNRRLLPTAADGCLAAANSCRATDRSRPSP